MGVKWGKWAPLAQMNPTRPYVGFLSGRDNFNLKMHILTEILVFKRDKKRV